MNDNERCSCRGRNDTSTLRGDTTLTRCGGNGTQIGNGSVLIDVNQVFDSCRDRDCFEDTRVFLDEASQALIEHTGQVRTRTAEICSSSISVDPVQLSRGFFRVTVRYYVRLECEACVCPGKTQCFEGLAVCEKSVVLYGGEGEKMVRLFINAGKKSKIRAKDIVGAIANEAGIPGKTLGEIAIFDEYTFVDVPNEFVRDILHGMKHAKIKGKRVHIEIAKKEKTYGKKRK